MPLEHSNVAEGSDEPLGSIPTFAVAHGQHAAVSWGYQPYMWGAEIWGWPIMAHTC